MPLYMTSPLQLCFVNCTQKRYPNPPLPEKKLKVQKADHSRSFCSVHMLFNGGLQNRIFQKSYPFLIKS